MLKPATFMETSCAACANAMKDTLEKSASAVGWRIKGATRIVGTTKESCVVDVETAFVDSATATRIPWAQSMESCVSATIGRALNMKV